jgi:hypothetical protein
LRVLSSQVAHRNQQLGPHRKGPHLTQEDQIAMSNIVIEHEPDVERLTSDAPPNFGECPVCSKKLRPRDRQTGQPREPKGSGWAARAKCDGCGTLLLYLGNKKWRVLTESDLSPEDLQADAMDRLFGVEF